MIRLMLLVPMAATLLACGLVARSDDPAAGVVETPAAPTEEPAAQLYELPPAATGVLPPPSVASETLIPLYAGDSLIEEKIIENPVVVRATLTSFSSDTIVYDNKYHVMLQFNLNVSEYLKGTGPSSIVALWVDGRPYDTIDKANDAKAIVLMERDAQWDDREAIIFLFDGLGGLRDYLKTEVATNDDTIREHNSVAASPSSSLPSSHTSQANLDTSRASPMFVRPPSDAPDSVSVLTRRASPLRSAGYAADSRIWRPSRGQWGCHIPYPDTDAEDSALLDEVSQPLLTPVSPPTAWHRGRSLPPPLCSVGHHLHLREYCAWFPASLGRSDCDRLHPPQTGFAH